MQNHHSQKAAPEAETLPEKVGRYEIKRLLGIGGMAKVYLANDPGTKRDVAIKVCSDPKHFDRFSREGLAATLSNHPNIVTVFVVDEDKDLGVSYIVMEYLPGKNLDEWLAAGVEFELEEVLKIGEQLASALSHAHENGILHRDIKASNVMYDRENGQIWLTDFGVAKIADLDDKTEAGLAVGTVHYMSPEQLDGDAVDGRSDVYSLGVVLYRLLAGHKPFDGRSVTQIIKRICNDIPEGMIKLKNTLPAPVYHIVETCLQKKPDERFASAEALWGALIDAQTDISAKSIRRPGSFKELLPKSLRVQWCLLTGLLVLVLGASSIGLLKQGLDEWRFERATQDALSIASSLASDVDLKLDMMTKQMESVDQRLNIANRLLPQGEVSVSDEISSTISWKKIPQNLLQSGSLNKPELQNVYGELGLYIEGERVFIRWPLMLYQGGEILGYIKVGIEKPSLSTADLGAAFGFFGTLTLALPLLLVAALTTYVGLWSGRLRGTLSRVLDGQYDRINAEEQNPVELQSLNDAINLISMKLRNIEPEEHDQDHEPVVVEKGLDEAEKKKIEQTAADVMADRTVFIDSDVFK